MVRRRARAARRAPRARATACVLVLADRPLDLPGAGRPALARLLAGDAVAAATCPAWTPRTPSQLVRRLLREGVVVPARRPAAPVGPVDLRRRVNGHPPAPLLRRRRGTRRPPGRVGPPVSRWFLVEQPGPVGP